MRINRALILCSLLMMTAQVVFADDGSAGDEAVIARLIADQAAAWSNGDAHAYAASFAEDGAFVNVRGTRFRGKAAFEQRHVELFAGVFHGSHQVQRIDRLVWLSRQSAFVELAVEVTGFRAMPPGIPTPPDGVLRTHLLQVLKKSEGHWLVEAYYNINVLPQGPPAPETTNPSTH
jgi:uncharacterized protein (TIGR02246 family)